jgi:AcrR family transcriptional regulator
LKDKELIIIEAAIKLFAKKGFASTSIQEIVSATGMSKGAFYLYFKSKDALLVAILNHYFDRVESIIQEYEGQDLPPREKFIRQLSALFHTFIENKEFIIMQYREQAIPLNDAVHQLMIQKHYENQQFQHRALKAIYGEEVTPYVWDLALMLEGLLQSYVKLLFFYDEYFDVDILVPFIMRRMDSLVQGIKGEVPIISDESTIKVLEDKRAFLHNGPAIGAIIEKMKKALAEMDSKEDLEVSLEVIEEEVSRSNPRLPVIQGMLSNFKEIPAFDSLCEEICRLYGIKI